MNQNKILLNTQEFVKKTLKYAEGGHDWFHIERVVNIAKQIAKSEQVDKFIVELGALLYDIADAKFYEGDETIGPKKARVFLEKQEVAESIILHIEHIIKHISFKSSLGDKTTFLSQELKVIQDADRLDALGAIGIARCFNYGGFKNRAIYDPNILPNLEMTKEEYKKSIAPSINHFYEKLLLLKDKMNTKTGKQLADNRHQYMLVFLEQFYAEWYGEK